MRGTIAVLATVGVLLLGGPSAAQPDADHLACYKIKDPLKQQGLLDLLSPQFGADQGCKIAKRALKFCVPVSKAVQSLVDLSAKPVAPKDPIDVPSAPAAGDYLCYKVKCPKRDIPDVTATDQFGSRDISKLKILELCAPAIKGEVPTTTTTTSTTTSTVIGVPKCEDSGAPTCGGTCPQTAEECVFSGTTCVCQTLLPCQDSGAPTCNGTCLGTADVCQWDGKDVCFCAPPLACGDSAPTCNGTCPTGLTCAADTNDKCFCS